MSQYLQTIVHATVLKMRCATADKVTKRIRGTWPGHYYVQIIRYHLENLVKTGNLGKQLVGGEAFYLSEVSDEQR